MGEVDNGGQEEIEDEGEKGGEEDFGGQEGMEDDEEEKKTLEDKKTK